ncbi:MAG: hypothetical protein ABEK59_01380 [Halobacteria archaeon]
MSDKKLDSGISLHGEKLKAVVEDPEEAEILGYGVMYTMRAMRRMSRYPSPPTLTDVVRSVNEQFDDDIEAVVEDPEEAEILGYVIIYTMRAMRRLPKNPSPPTLTDVVRSVNEQFDADIDTDAPKKA